MSHSDDVSSTSPDLEVASDNRTKEATATTSRPSSGPDRPGAKLRGILAILTSATSAQTGAAIGAHAFPAMGPIGVVAVRQVVAAAVLLPAARPKLHRLGWQQWWPCLVLGGVFLTMNLAVYSAIDRIGLGLAVTLEFLGPLTIALLSSRGVREIGLAALAGIGVYVLILPGPASDLIGIGLGLLGGAGWAAYILTNSLAGRRLSGLQAPAVGSLISATMAIPILVWLAVDGRLWGQPLLLAATAGVLSSAIPYAADLTALRYVPKRFFAVFTSVHPVIAALAGVVVLGQLLSFHEWLGIAIVVIANVLATLRTR